MKKLVLLAIVLAICLPGYATVLVYKLNTNLKMVQYTDPNRMVADQTSVNRTIKAYVVFNIDSSNLLNVVSVDDGNQPTAIMYGNSKTEGNWKKTIGGGAPNSAVLIATAASGVFGSQTFNSYKLENGTKPKATAVKFSFSDEPNGTQPFELIADVTGNDSKTGRDLLPDTIYLPWTLRGNTSVTSGNTESEEFVNGFSTGTLSLDFNEVHYASDHDLSVAEEVDRLNDSGSLSSYPDIGTSPIPVP